MQTSTMMAILIYARLALAMIVVVLQAIILLY